MICHLLLATFGPGFLKLASLRQRRTLIAQACSLPYRRFVIGSVSATPTRSENADDPQAASLRYGRLKICATVREIFELFIGRSSVVSQALLSTFSRSTSHSQRSATAGSTFVARRTGT